MGGRFDRRPRVVAFGGGHGLSASLRALRRLDVALTAVVTVADDGGSSGRIRREFDAVPPGDLRQALVALAAEDDPVAAALFQHRLRGTGGLGGHAVGNLVLTGLADLLGGMVPALDQAGRMLRTCGRVLPMAAQPLDIEADVSGLGHDPGAVTVVRGQHAVATTSGHVRRVRLRPGEPVACPEAVDAVRAADAVVLGPGSWFTSVLPHFLVPALRDAVVDASARRVLVLNLSTDGETDGWPIEGHLAALAEHAPALRVDVVVADPSVVRDRARLAGAAESLGGRLVVAPVAVADGTPRHEPGALASVLRAVLDVSSGAGDETVR